MAALKWYTFHQNNSGGWFNEDVGEFIVVQAANEEEACRIAEAHGVYFDGVDAGQDCECCGDRWSRPWGSDDEPTIYGGPAREYQSSWMTDAVRIIPLGGPVERVKSEQSL